MPVRGLLVAVVLLGVLAGAVYWSERKGTSAPETTGPNAAAPKLVALKEEEIRQVEIRREGTPPVLVEKDNSGQWQMKWPEALRVDQEAVNGLVSAYTGLTWDRLIEDKAGDLGMYGLQSPQLDIRVTVKDAKTHRLLVGAQTPTQGFYAKLEGDPRVFKLSSSTKTSLDKTHRELRDKRMLTFNSEKLKRVEWTAQGRTLEFEKSGAEWRIVKPRPMRADNLQVDELIRKLQEATMDTAAGQAPKAAPARAALARVTDDKAAQQIEYLKGSDGFYARSSVVEGVHKLSGDPSEVVNKDFESYRNKKLFDFGFNEPAKIEMRDDARMYSFVKGGETWWQNGKQVDSVGVQSLIDKLRELSSIKFLEAGFGAPVVEITITSDAGKRTETVSISRSGSRFLARRLNEPQIYELDGKSVEEIQRAAADVKAPPPLSTPPPPKK